MMRTVMMMMMVRGSGEAFTNECAPQLRPLPPRLHHYPPERLCVVKLEGDAYGRAHLAGTTTDKDSHTTHSHIHTLRR